VDASSTRLEKCMVVVWYWGMDSMIRVLVMLSGK
jgi:hypothetical protein